jgi:hypothetical protein
MTFTPQVLSQVDNNNSTISSSSATFNGISTVTTGFNTLILTIYSTTDSDPGGIEIEFSDDNLNWIQPYTDTYFASSIFTKNYLIIKKYYKINYNNSSLGTFTLSSRLSTDLDSSITQNTSITVFDNNIENTLDAFGKLRVSNPTTLLDIRFPGQSTGSTEFLSNNLQICNASSGSYTATYSNSKLVVNASGNGYYISQSRNYCTYQPGKSLLVLASGILYPGDNDYTSRIGYFNNQTPIANPLIVNNGVYFEHSGGVYSLNISNNGTITNIIQSDWNIDKMNGSGPSGLTLNFANTQLFVIDLEWLGVGRIRFGFYAYGRIQYCHQVTNINILTQPYSVSINLPICYSIHSNSSPGASATNFTQICSTVISEGGYTPLGRTFSVSSGSPTGITINGNTEEPILFLRGNVANTNYKNQIILPINSTMIATTNNDLILFKLVLFLAGTYTGTQPTWNDVNSDYSVAQYGGNLSSGYLSIDGIVLDEGYFYGKGTSTVAPLGDIFSSQILQLTSDINNNSDILVLTATFVNGNPSSTATVFATLNWQEIY